VADPFDDLKAFRWAGPTPEAPAAEQSGAAKLPRPAEGEAYLGGQVPMSWIERATRLPGKAWAVGSALWFVGNRSRAKRATVRLTLKTRRRFGFTRKAAYRALAALEGAGLVRVNRHVGRPLVVTILPAPPREV
jgi:hypothetical protein